MTILRKIWIHAKFKISIKTFIYYFESVVAWKLLFFPNSEFLMSSDHLQNAAITAFSPKFKAIQIIRQNAVSILLLSWFLVNENRTPHDLLDQVPTIPFFFQIPVDKYTLTNTWIEKESNSRNFLHNQHGFFEAAIMETDPLVWRTMSFLLNYPAFLSPKNKLLHLTAEHF